VFGCHGSLSSLKRIGEAKRSLPRQRNRHQTRFSRGGESTQILGSSVSMMGDLNFPKQKAASGFQRPLVFRWQSELEFQITAQA
jgi:hypothetical protein